MHWVDKWAEQTDHLDEMKERSAEIVQHVWSNLSAALRDSAERYAERFPDSRAKYSGSGYEIISVACVNPSSTVPTNRLKSKVTIKLDRREPSVELTYEPPINAAPKRLGIDVDGQYQPVLFLEEKPINYEDAAKDILAPLFFRKLWEHKQRGHAVQRSG